jgi:hypothetical protein
MTANVACNARRNKRRRAAGVPHSTGHVDVGGNQGAEGGEELLQRLPRQHLVHVVEVEAPRESRVKGHEEHSNQALAQRAKPVKPPQVSNHRKV